MILLTVGSQLPFDRLVRAMDVWCGWNPGRDVVAQIGEPGAHGYRPQNFEWHPFIAPRRFDELMNRADLIVAHAGMGSIIQALRRSKPIVIMPRKASLGEHRNEHQHATAVRFADRRGIYVAYDETTLAATLERASVAGASTGALSAYADPDLIGSVRRFILTGNTDIDRELGEGREVAVPLVR